MKIQAPLQINNRRSSKLCTIGEGTSEIQRIVIAKQLFTAQQIKSVSNCLRFLFERCLASVLHGCICEMILVDWLRPKILPPKLGENI